MQNSKESGYGGPVRNDYRENKINILTEITLREVNYIRYGEFAKPRQRTLEFYSNEFRNQIYCNKRLEIIITFMRVVALNSDRNTRSGMVAWKEKLKLDAVLLAVESANKRSFLPSVNKASKLHVVVVTFFLLAPKHMLSMIAVSLVMKTVIFLLPRQLEHKGPFSEMRTRKLKNAISPLLQRSPAMCKQSTSRVVIARAQVRCSMRCPF